MSVKRRFRRVRHSETGEFLWLISLSDLMILLFMFFVALFSFTKKNLKQADVKRIIEALRDQKQAAASAKSPIDQIRDNLNQWAKSSGVSDQITVLKKDDGVYVEIKDRVLFGSGEFTIHPDGLKAVASLAQVLKKVPEPYQIGIEGHTDDSPIHTSRIQNNWQLSSERALSVLTTLDLPPSLLKRVVLLAHGEMMPLAPNRDRRGNPIPDNQSRNRRVTVRIFQ